MYYLCGVFAAPWGRSHNIFSYNLVSLFTLQLRAKSVSSVKLTGNFEHGLAVLKGTFRYGSFT